MTKKAKTIAVLMGGWSAERDVSLASGAAVANALTQSGCRVQRIDVTRDMRALLDQLDPKPDVVFNALHGRFGEDGGIQGLLEGLGLPYTHSGVLASAIAMDKPMTRRLFAEAGIPHPDGGVFPCKAVQAAHPMEPPYVLKPLNEGSSVGVRLVLAKADAPGCGPDWAFGKDVLVERYIPGREICVAVMGDAALGAIEIRPREGFYDYAAKYTEDRAEHAMPAPIAPEAYEEALQLGLRAHCALGCKGVTRADLRYDDSHGEPGKFYVLEVNTQPGLTTLSLVPEIAAHAGIAFPELVTWMVEDAQCES
ncbi:MAG: D-alanine--D-alanine ligase [Rhodospirillaceae bacterium]|nr:MAG: D-alanine--D-alanine ligase [Rhodospirillaceae bacterium]